MKAINNFIIEKLQKINSKTEMSPEKIYLLYPLYPKSNQLCYQFWSDYAICYTNGMYSFVLTAEEIRQKIERKYIDGYKIQCFANKYTVKDRKAIINKYNHKFSNLPFLEKEEKLLNAQREDYDEIFSN